MITHAVTRVGPSADRYTSDITCTWPVTGKFTQQQALIYNAVLDAHTAVIKAMKPGVAWPVSTWDCTCNMIAWLIVLR